MLNNRPFKKINFKNVPADIDIYVVSNDIITAELKLKYGFDIKYSSDSFKKNSFIRSRLLIEILDLTRSKNMSISHTDNISAITVSNNYLVGIDIENSFRNLTEKLSKRILDKNDFLEIKPIQIWTLMESSYKCLNGKGKHFLKYVFNKKDKDFFLLENEKRISSVTHDLNGYTFGISFIQDN